MSDRKKPAAAGRLIAGCALIFFAVVLLAALWPQAEETATDFFFRVRGSRPLADEFLFVPLGDRDIDALGGWPVTRDYFGYMTHVLQALGAKAIGFDFLFDQPSSLYPENDRILADFFESARNVCLPAVLPGLAPENAREAVKWPALIFRQRAAAIGFSNLGDALQSRRMPVAVVRPDSLLLAFGVELARIYLGLDGRAVLRKGALELFAGDSLARRVPVDRNLRVRLNHFGDVRHARSISFVDLLQAYKSNPDSLRKTVAGRLVLVGATSPSLPVLKSTPLASLLPGSLLHATLAENIIHENYVRELPFPATFLILLLMSFSPLGLLWLAAPWRPLACLFVAFAYFVLAFAFFTGANTLWPVVYPLLALPMSSLFVMLFSGRLQQRRALREHFAALQAAEKRLRDAESALARERAGTSFSAARSRELLRQREEMLQQLEQQLAALQAVPSVQSSPANSRFSEIIHAPGGRMASVLQLVEKVAGESIPVLVLGETGTGKELVARAIHAASPRRHRAFVAVNCGALVETLLESELFGHEKGSFTGAHSRKKGRFELADGGTIFLDEITETTPAFQAKLLRVLQEGAFERVGGEATLRVDVRVICACNTDIRQRVEHGAFRADLFYRLNGFPVELPPLRERPEDILPLSVHFLEKHGFAPPLRLAAQAMERLQQYAWPGNVRELENVLRRAAILARSEGRALITAADLPDDVRVQSLGAGESAAYLSLDRQILDSLRAYGFSRSAITRTARALGNRDRGTVTEYLRGMIFAELAAHDFHVAAAARALAGTGDPEAVARVQAKIQAYLRNLQAAQAGATAGAEKQTRLAALYKGLPQKYHAALTQVLENLDKITG